MEPKTYLESGILELYAAGALSLAESAEVDAMASRHPEIADELVRAQEALAAYGSTQERQPRPALRTGILKSMPGKGRSPSPDKPDRSASTLAYKYLLAACLASLVISTFASYFFYNRWSEAEDKNIALLNEKNVLTQSYTAIKSAFDKAYNDMLIMQDLQTGMVTLMATDTAQSYAARVYWNRFSHETYLDIRFLPALSGGKQYQLWAMHGGKAVDAGIFDVSEEGGLQPMKAVYQADEWSVTVEPSGGSTVPTMSSLFLSSKKQPFSPAL